MLFNQKLLNVESTDKKYVRKEVITITRTEEVSVIFAKSPSDQKMEVHFIKGLMMLIKKYLFSYKWIRGNDNG